MKPANDVNLTLCLPRQSSGGNPHEPVIVESPKPTITSANYLVIKVDRFGFSANNVTYQALGEAPHFRYFDFHQAPEAGDVSPKTHGLVPVWGFGTVIASSHPRINTGERIYGYLAPTRYLLVPVSPADVNKHAFYVPRPHLPEDRRPYNQILRCAADPQYTPTPTAEDLMMLYRPLFWTSYWCEDWLFSSSYRGGAKRILISSASSKTAFSLAYLIGKRVKKGGLPGIKIIGVTSKKNVQFTKRLSLYDTVLDYDTFTKDSSLRLNGERWIYVDVAGNDKINHQVFDHFSTSKHLAASVALGMTNLSPSAPEASTKNWSTNTFVDTPSLSSTTAAESLEQFFMVEWLNVRKHQFSPPQIFNMQNEAWKELMKDCVGWVSLDRVYGSDGVKLAYEEVAKGGLGPDKGFIWSLWDKQDISENTSVKL